MNTKKTLADAQPGGRVRLGDQAELDRLEYQAWARELLPCPFCGNSAEFVPYKDNGLTLKCTSMGCVQRNQRTLRYGIDWLRTSMTEHWNTRALSARPSPGGQGAPRCAQHCQNGFADICLASQRDGVICPEDSCDIDDGIRHNHFAARQPVGEQRAALWIQFAENGNIRFWTKDQDRALAESFLHARPLTAFYASPQPPAQAVDLGDFKALYHAYVRLLESGRDRIRDLGGACDPVDVMEANDVDLQAARRVIDSKAVGK
nr:hypothetical protein [Stenotrophomonas geniculata]